MAKCRSIFKSLSTCRKILLKIKFYEKKTSEIIRGECSSPQPSLFPYYQGGMRKLQLLAHFVLLASLFLILILILFLVT
jgi:hypothetical protein